MERITEIVTFINGIAWGYPMLILIVGIGLYLMFALHFIPIRKFFYGFQQWLGRRRAKTLASTAEGDISAHNALMTALSATIGTGNIIGVATAIAIGGPGALFWMWMTALVGMATKYSEAVLAVRFREKDAKGHYVGGPMYFIKNGLSAEWKWLGGVFAFFATIAAFGIGNSIQVNSIANVFQENYAISTRYTGGVLALLVFIVTIGGVKRIAQVAGKIVPFMVAIYILVALFVLLLNAEKVPSVFAQIFAAAFSGEAVTGGFAAMVVTGVARGVFSNEAGLGSASIAHAAAQTDSPVRQGSIAILGTFFDTIIVCSMTGFAIILFGQWDVGDLTGATLTSQAFATAIPGIGNHFVVFSLALFAFTTILGWSYYGEKAFQYLLGIKWIPVYKAFWIAMILFVTFIDIDLKFLWLVADTLNALMAIPNLIALVLLSPVVVQLTKSYFRRGQDLDVNGNSGSGDGGDRSSV